jgi:hypothetical protein
MFRPSRKIRDLVPPQVKPITPEDAAKSVLFLTLDAAALIIDQVHNVYAGKYMKVLGCAV